MPHTTHFTPVQHVPAFRFSWDETRAHTSDDTLRFYEASFGTDQVSAAMADRAAVYE